VILTQTKIIVGTIWVGYINMLQIFILAKPPSPQRKMN